MKGAAHVGRLHVLTDETIQDTFSHEDLARQAAEGGADVVQLREKRGWTTRQLVETAQVVRQALQGTSVRLVIDDRVDVALAAEVAARSPLAFDGESERDVLSALLAHFQREIPDARHRRALQIDVDDLDDVPADVARALWAALELFHRASSLAESLHSWLRPHLHAHKGMPDWLLPLLQLFWNHHTFQRGKRKGQSPLELAGVEQPRSWTEVLDLLVQRQLVTPAAC